MAGCGFKTPLRETGQHHTGSLPTDPGIHAAASPGDRGCVVKWSDVRGPEGPPRPRLVMALSVEETKPRLIYDEKTLTSDAGGFLSHTVLVIMSTQKTQCISGQTGMIYLRNLKRTLKLNKTHSPLGNHPDGLISYQIIIRYGIGAKNSLTVAADRTANGSRRGPITYPKNTLLKHPEANEK